MRGGKCVPFNRQLCFALALGLLPLAPAWGACLQSWTCAPPRRPLGLGLPSSPSPHSPSQLRCPGLSSSSLHMTLHLCHSLSR